MARRTDPDQRRWFYQRHQDGASYEQIAAQTGYSKECVRYWCRRQRDQGAVETHYYRTKTGVLSEFDGLVRYGILRLRCEHPRWGPSRILFWLQQRPGVSGKRLPSMAQVGRYLHQWERFRRKKPKRPRGRHNGATAIQQRWMIDFKMGIALANGEQVNLHTLCDPVGEICLDAQIYPAGPVGQPPKKVNPEQVRQTVRHCAAKYGYLPQEIQTDGETNLVATRNLNNFPTGFTLWLTGLGIQHLVIRPGRPTDNSEVERFHRTLDEYAIQARRLPPDRLTLQVTLDDALDQLATQLPSQAPGCHGSAPLLAHPELLQPQRPYQPEQEQAWFDLRRVDDYLAHFTWQRIVGKTGQVWLGAKIYSLNRDNARKLVSIRFDPLTRQMVFSDTQGEKPELLRLPAKGLTVDEILGIPHLTVPQQLPLPLFDALFHQGYVVKEQQRV